MKHGHAALCLAYAHIAGRKIDGVLDIAILQVICQLLHRHHRAVVLGLLCGSAQMGKQDNPLHVCNLWIGKIADIVAHLSGIQSCRHIIVIDQGIPGEVEDYHPVLHDSQFFLVNHSSGGIHKRHMDGDIITFLENDVRVGDMLYVPGQSPGRINGNIWVIPVYLHSQMGGCVGNLSADGSQADNTQLLALNLAACKCLLALLCVLGDVVVLRIGLAPLNTAHDIPGSHEHTRNHQLLYAVGIGSRRIEYNDALLRAGIQRNVIDTGSRPAHSQQVFRKFHIVHGSAAHQDGVSVRHVVCHLISGRKQLRAALRNGVQAMNFFHNNPTLLYMSKDFYFLCFFSKSAMNSTSFSTPSAGIAL